MLYVHVCVCQYKHGFRDNIKSKHRKKISQEDIKSEPRGFDTMGDSNLASFLDRKS